MPNLVRLVREPLAPQDASPLLVLLHGLGSNEDDLMQLGNGLQPELRVVTLRAPHAYSVGGYAWFQIQWGPRGIEIDLTQVQASVQLLAEQLEGLRAEFSPSKLLLGGFSQGAIMTVGLAGYRPDLLQGAISMSGRFLPELLASAPPALAQVPFLVQHGVYDEVLAPEGSRQLFAALKSRGVSVEAHEYEMGHEVTWPSLRDLAAWIDRQIA